MGKIRDTFIFLAGAEFFHTMSHIMLPYIIKLPFNVGAVEVTSQLNFYAIIINAIITVAFLWGAGRFKS